MSLPFRGKDWKPLGCQAMALDSGFNNRARDIGGESSTPEIVMSVDDARSFLDQPSY